ncbi:Notchless-like WD40 repeat-containing protein, partial [Pseudoloma neurophilia]
MKSKIIENKIIKNKVENTLEHTENKENNKEHTENNKENKILIKFYDLATQKESTQFQVPLKIKRKQLLELSQTKGSLFYNGNIINEDLCSVLPKDYNNEETFLIKISNDKEQKVAKYCVSSFSGHESAVLDIFSFENDIYTVGGDFTIRKWDINTKLQSKIVKYHENWAQIVKVFDKIVCTGSLDSTICIFDRDLNFKTKLIGHLKGITDIEMLDDYIITSSRDKTVKFWQKEGSLGSVVGSLEKTEGS